MDKLGLNLGFFIFQILNFTVLAILLARFAYGPIVKMLEDRKRKIAQGLEDARVAAEARANAEKEAAKIVAEAQTKAAEGCRTPKPRGVSHRSWRAPLIKPQPTRTAPFPFCGWAARSPGRSAWARRRRF